MPRDPATAAAELSALIADPMAEELADDVADLRLARAALDGPVGTDDPTLLIALVGPSGTGRSTLMNALAAEQLSRPGILRPTTRRTVRWGEGGVRLDDADVERVPASPDGLSLVDTPPWETDADGVGRVLAVADIALVTVNPLRYADAATSGLITFCDALGVPVLLVVNRVPVPDRDALLDDIAAKLGRSPSVVLAAADHSDGKVRVEVLHDLLRDIAGQTPSVRAARRSGAVAHLRAATASILDQIGRRRERRREVRDAIEAVRAESAETIPADAASLSWPEARLLLAETAFDSAIETRSSLARSVPSIPSDDLPPLDAQPALDDWHERITNAALDSVRTRPVRALAGSTVRRQVWRCAVDGARRPSWLARTAVGGSWQERSETAREELAAILATPSDVLCDQAHARVEVEEMPDGAKIAELVHVLFQAYGGVGPGAPVGVDDEALRSATSGAATRQGR
jgi:hypothetical protein